MQFRELLKGLRRIMPAARGIFLYQMDLIFKVIVGGADESSLITAPISARITAP